MVSIYNIDGKILTAATINHIKKIIKACNQMEDMTLLIKDGGIIKLDSKS